ncbi:MAG: recombinase RecT [Candidatus Cloacimonetes bacterium]|nr:recombinase RecT [Candidatus Cloacimonadota bacterium]
MSNLQKPQTQYELTPMAMFRGDLDKMDDELRKVLPPEIPIEKFKRVTITALQENADLLKADRKSLFKACLLCASAGLYPNGKEAAFTIRKGKVVYTEMVRGVIKRILNNTDVVKIKSRCVFTHDLFEYKLGTDEYLLHIPNLDIPVKNIEKEFKCVYAIFTLKNGQEMIDVMPKYEVDRRRAISTGSHLTFWSNFYDRMARKSVIHRLSEDLDLEIKYDDEYFENDEVTPENKQYKRLPQPNISIDTEQNPPFDTVEEYKEPLQVLENETVEEPF